MFQIFYAYFELIVNFRKHSAYLSIIGNLYAYLVHLKKNNVIHFQYLIYKKPENCFIARRFLKFSCN